MKTKVAFVVVGDTKWP